MMVFNKLVFGLLMLTLTFGGWHCAGPWTGNKEDIRLYTVMNGTFAANYSAYFFTAAFEADSAGSAVFPARKGDMLVVQNQDAGIILKSSGELPDTLQISGKDSLVYLNGRLAGIELKRNQDMLPWFSRMSDDEIRGLRSIAVKSPIPDAYLPYLERISKMHPELSLTLEEDARDSLSHDLGVLNHLFHPSFMSISGPLPNPDTLSKCISLETLFLFTEDSLHRDNIPFLPALKELILSDEEDSIQVDADLLINNPQLEKLVWDTKGGSAIPDLAVLPKLEELRLFISDSTDISDLLHPNGNLKALGIYGEDITGIGSLADKKKLNWLALPANTTQLAFDTIVRSLPELSSLHLFSCEKIRDYAALQQARKLRYLVISDTAGNAKSLYPLSSLKYLSIPEALYKDSARINALQKALPKTVIAPNKGFCMGSGWILFLFPFAALLVFWQLRFIGTRLTAWRSGTDEGANLRT